MTEMASIKLKITSKQEQLNKLKTSEMAGLKTLFRGITEITATF